MKGQIHSIESLTAAILFMFFLVTVLPTVAPGTDETLSIDTRVRSTLGTLDTTGRLRGPLLDQDLGEVRDRVADPIVGMDQEVAGLYLNSTTGRSVGDTTVQFRVDKDATADELLRVWDRDGDIASITVEGSSLPPPTDGYETYRISRYTGDGANTLSIDTAAGSAVGYSIDRYVAMETGVPPDDANVFTTSYFVAGANATFFPVEVTVASWR